MEHAATREIVPDAGTSIVPYIEVHIVGLSRAIFMGNVAMVTWQGNLNYGDGVMVMMRTRTLL